jgi:hypothetical protein
VSTRGVGLVVKNDHKAHVTSSRFDLNTLPTCGARTRSGGLCKHKATFLMVDVNAMVEPLQGQSPQSMAKATIGTFMA